MNVNLAPVLDVYHRPGTSSTSTSRSYSERPEHGRARCGAGLHRRPAGRGVAATAKHFPGLGSATADQNTDAGPVTLTVPLSRAAHHRRGAVPGGHRRRRQARHAVLGGVPGAGPDRPAGLSPHRRAGELRARLASAASPSPTPWKPAHCGLRQHRPSEPCWPPGGRGPHPRAPARDVTQGEDAVRASPTHSATDNSTRPLRRRARPYRRDPRRSHIAARVNVPEPELSVDARGGLVGRFESSDWPAAL